MTSQAELADDDLQRLEVAGLGASQRVTTRLRTGFARQLQSRGAFRFSASAELRNHLAPILARTMAVSFLMGERRSILSAADLALDRFSEIMRQVRAAGVGTDLTRVQRGYARHVYRQMGELGSKIDGRVRATISALIADGEPPGRALKILKTTLDKLGVGDAQQSVLETLYRTQISVAYHAGRWRADQDDDRVWGYTYVQIDRPSKRLEHVPLDGTTLPKDDPFWRKYWPPNGWNCGCTVETLYKKRKTKKPGKINGKVPKPDKGFKQNFALEMAFDPNEPYLALDWDESKHPRDPMGTATGGQFTAEMPASMTGLTSVKALGGSTGATLYEDEHGRKYVLKGGASEEHAINEYKANELYRQLGVPVPQSTLVDLFGKKHLLTRFVEGKPLNELTKAEQQVAYEKLREHFAADALLGNWDVIGLGKDNIVVDKKGIPWRVDNGGALSFRAKGGSKGGKWNDQLSELKTMREQGTAGEVFGSLSDAQVKAQVQSLPLTKFKNEWDKIDPVLAQRRKNLISMSVDASSWPWEKKEGYQIVAEAKAAVAKPATSNKLDAYQQLHDKIKIPLMKAGLSKHQIEQTALANSLRPSSTHVLVSKDWKPEHHQAISEQFPGKLVRATKLGPIIKKELGATTTKVQVAKKQGALHSIFNVTKTEKEWAVSQAKTAKEKAAAEALHVVDAPDAVFLPSDGSPHWKRAKIENGSKYANRLEKGTYHNPDGWQDKINAQTKEAVSSWKGSPGVIRQYMWDGTVDKPESELPDKHKNHYEYKNAKALLSGELSKFPKYEGVLYRGVSHVVPGTEFYEAIKTPGNVIELAAHMGCSRKSGKSVGSFSSGKCLFRIATKNGRSIEDMHGYKSEHETLLERGTKYRVVGVAHDVMCQREGGEYKKVAVVVDLEEIDAKEKHTHRVALSFA